jgi:hypothetical protein
MLSSRPLQGREKEPLGRALAESGKSTVVQETSSALLVAQLALPEGEGVGVGGRLHASNH